MAAPDRRLARRRAALGRLAGDERGAEQLEYVLVFAAVVIPLVVAARLLWAALLQYFVLEAFVVDMPLF